MKTRMYTLFFLLSVLTGLATAQSLPPIQQGSFTDPRDGQTYKTIKIGKLEFMAENLRFVTKPGCWRYENDPQLGSIYGCLYDWKTAKNVAPPPGWHLPNDAEWQQLIHYLGGAQVAGGKLKEKGTRHWLSPNTGATDEIGFAALPGGRHVEATGYLSIGRSAWFWSSTTTIDGYGGILAARWILSNNSSGVLSRIEDYLGDGFSVRLVRNY